jgi:uncharacterized protein (TIGR03067 family)
MTLVRVLALGVAAVTLTVATADDKPAPLDPAKLVGDWSIVEGLKAGEKSGDDAKKGTVIVDKEKITLKSDDMTFAFSYTLDAKKSPAEIDLKIVEPEGLAGATAKGIIKLEKDKVTLCYHPMMGDRPTKFESTKDNGFYLFTMEKKKSDK